MRRWSLARVLGLLSAVMAGSPMALDDVLSGFSGLPPGEQYRQMSLMLLMSAATGPELLDLLPAHDEAARLRGIGAVNPDDYVTPLVRIVDQESMLAGAARVLAFVDANRGRIRSRQEAIEADYPVLIGMVDRNALMEDAIIIRNAVADAMVYADLADGAPAATLIEAYHRHTVYLRNELEFARFNEELVRITDEAVNSVGGKMDAYQRMFADEVESETFDRHIEAAEFIYERRGEFDPRAGELTEEIIESMVLAESQVNR